MRITRENGGKQEQRTDQKAPHFFTNTKGEREMETLYRAKSWQGIFNKVDSELTFALAHGRPCYSCLPPKSSSQDNLLTASLISFQQLENNFLCSLSLLSSKYVYSF